MSDNWPYGHFSEQKLSCKCCGVNGMDHGFMAKLELLRILVGFPMIETSGYRCPKHNARVSKTGEGGPHTTGKAIDIMINRKNMTVLVRFALNQGFTGIGIKQHGPDAGRIIHLDMTERPFQIIWTYP